MFISILSPLCKKCYIATQWCGVTHLHPPSVYLFRLECPASNNIISSVLSFLSISSDLDINNISTVCLSPQNNIIITNISCKLKSILMPLFISIKKLLISAWNWKTYFTVMDALVRILRSSDKRQVKLKPNKPCLIQSPVLSTLLLLHSPIHISHVDLGQGVPKKNPQSSVFKLIYRDSWGFIMEHPVWSFENYRCLHMLNASLDYCKSLDMYLLCKQTDNLYSILSHYW